jgi:hypothetical protein
MIELQRSPVVQETRSAFQTAMQHRFIDAVERLSGRKVLAFGKTTSRRSIGSRRTSTSCTRRMG